MFSNYFSKLIKEGFSKRRVLFGLAVFVLIGAGAAVLYLAGPGKVSPQASIKTEKPSLKAAPLAVGKQTYYIRTDNPKNPQIIQVDVDPLDVKKGEAQKVAVSVKDTENKPITKETKVEATVFTDNASTPFSLSLKRADGPDLVTLWEGSWECQDAHDSTYMMTIVAKDAFGESKVDLSFR